MATSVVPAVGTALKASLAARAGLTGVQITDGLPWQPDGDFIAILDADPHDQRTAGMRSSPHPREEEFTLIVLISALRKGDTDHTEVVARAYVLAAEIETDLRNDPTIDASLGNGWAVVTALPVSKRGPDANGQREALIEAHITCRARI